VPSRSHGAWLVIASLAFWLSWVLMPGVGVTDPTRIFALVGAHRANVYASVVFQLLSAAAYAPGIAAILATTAPRPSGSTLTGCVLVLIGAMGSAADSIFHLVAYEMTAPGIPLDAMVPVMRRLQGRDLAFLLPLIVAFLLGHALVVGGLRKRGPLAGIGALVLLIAPAIVIVGVPGVARGYVSARVVGLAFLGAISASLLFLGLSMMFEQDRTLERDRPF
jgi:hypothetical protein